MHEELKRSLDDLKRSHDDLKRSHEALRKDVAANTAELQEIRGICDYTSHKSGLLYEISIRGILPQRAQAIEGCKLAMTEFVNRTFSSHKGKNAQALQQMGLVCHSV